jgi:very-short-patch-repair endonuclease
VSFVPRPPDDTDRARRLRRESTDAELRLWSRLRAGQLGVRFRRQEPIGQYIVDFVCRRQRLIIEVDGSQHAGSIHDRQRDDWLRDQGYDVVRFWNEDVFLHTDDVVETIVAALLTPP